MPSAVGELVVGSERLEKQRWPVPVPEPVPACVSERENVRASACFKPALPSSIPPLAFFLTDVCQSPTASLRLSLLHPVVFTFLCNVHLRWTKKVHHLHLGRPCHRCSRRKQHPPQQGRFPINVPLPAMLPTPCSLDARTRLSSLLRSFLLRCLLRSSFNRPRYSALGLLCSRRTSLLPPKPPPTTYPGCCCRH